MTDGRHESRAFRIAIYAMLAVGAVPVLLPFYWMLLASVQTKERVSATPPDWTPMVPRAYLTIDGQELQVVVIDDSRASGTGVSRVKIAHDLGAVLLVPAGRIERQMRKRHFATIDGVRRHVVPDESGPPRPTGVARVFVPGLLREETVAASAIEVVEETATFWTVLGAEIPVRRDPRAGPIHGGHLVVQFLRDAPDVRIAPSRLNPMTTAGQALLLDRNVAARVVSSNSDRGFAVVQLICPPGGLDVAPAELREERRIRRFAQIDGRRVAVRVIQRDAESGAVRVEMLDSPRVAEVPADAVESADHETYRTSILGEMQAVEPLADVPAADANVKVPVRVPDAIAVAADRIRHESRLEPQWVNFRLAWREQTFGLFAINTLFVAALVVLGTVLSCGLVGYAFARLEFRGRDALFLVMLATLMIPGQVTSIPTFVMFAKLGWIDSYKPLIVPSLLAGSAFFVFLFRQFMLGIPKDLEDAARVDGCGPLATWWLVMMPLCRPVIVTVAVFSFVGVWNDFLGPLLYINSDEKQTIALGLQNFKSTFQNDDPQLIMAASVMAMIPSLILFFLAQKAFIRGVVVTGVKG